MESKPYKFKVEGFDPGDKIGEGEHTRAIILCELEGVVPVDCASSHFVSARHNLCSFFRFLWDRLSSSK